MATLRTVFLDTALTGYSNLANAYDPNVFNVVLLNNPAAGAMQIQNYLTANQLDASAINVVSASASVNGLFTSRVVFIDPGVANAAALIAAVPANATIVMLNAGTDGVQQISDFLAHNTGTVGAIDIISNIASVDVLSHGDAGEVTLGSTVLNASTIDTYRAQLADIGSHLAAGADILLYGCDVAAGTTGQQFIQELANATGADVAASTDLTGNAAAGGDWVLEASTGTIQTVAISAAAYTGVLDNATAIGSNFTISADTGTSSTDFFTKTATQTITGTFTASTSGTQAPTIYVSTDGSGAARTAATVTYTDNAGSGTFSVTVDLVTGAGKSIQFWTGQNGSNQIPNSAKAYTLDTIAPAATAIVTAINADTGSSGTDFITKTVSQAVSGTYSGTLDIVAATAETIQVSADGSTWINAIANTANHTWSASEVNLASGSGTLSVRTVDVAGNVTAGTPHIYTLDTTINAPTVSLSHDNGSDKTDKITNDASLTVLAPAESVTRTYKVDSAAASATYVAPTVNGSHTVVVTDVDTAGNTASSTIIFNLDTAINAPTVSLSHDNGSSNTDKITNDASLTVLAPAETVTRTYKVDSAAASSTYVAPTANGSHTVVVTDVDTAGNTASSNITFNLDTKINTPIVSLSHDNGSSNTDKITNDASLTLSTPTETVTRTYTIDGGTASSTYAAPAVNGSHTVVVTDVDTAGNTASSSITFNLDTKIAQSAITLNVDSGANNTDTLTNDASLTLSALDSDASRVITVDGNTVSAYDASSLAEGAHTVSISDTDAAGNTSSASTSFTLDTKIAKSAISLDTDSGANNTDTLTNDASLTLSALDSDASRVITVDGKTVTSYDASSLAQGAHTVSISDTDAAGNTSSASTSFTLDTKIAKSAITLNVDSGANNTDTLTNNASLTLSALDSDASRVITVDGKTVTSYDASSLAQGAHTVSISDTDAAGNTSSASTSFTLDTKIAKSAITLNVDSGNNNTDTLTNDASLTLSALDSDASRMIKVDGNTVTSYDASSLADGAHTVSISDTDAAGNTSSASTSFTLDTKIAKSAVSLNVDSGNNSTDTLTNQAGLTLSTPAETVTRTYTVDGGTASATYVAPTVDGSHTVMVKDVDAAGNTASSSISFTLDSTGPLFTSSTTATVVENVGANQIIYQAAATDAHTFAYSLQAGADASAFSIDSNGAVHLLANPDFETKSSYAFTVLATDAAGNVSHQSVTLGITDINEAPQTSPIALSTVENAAILIPVVPDYAYDVDANDVVTLSSVGPVKLSWAADTTSTALINPVTKQNVDLSKLSTQVTISADGKTLTVNPAAELDWATTGEKLVATFNYTVHDNHGLTTTDSVTLTIWGSTGDKGLNLIGGNGNDLLVGSNGENVLQGGNGNDTLTGGTATDALYGGNGDDKVSGGDGIDYLYGDSGNDVLDGGAAHDILSGGKGNDILTGGSGADGFVFEPQFGTDRITDFHMSEGDRLYFVDLFAQPISAHDFVAKYVTHVNNNNSDLLISMAGGSITLVGVSDTTALEGAISFGMPS
jgi:large repetitive protein